jgi:hypothetical protein
LSAPEAALDGAEVVEVATLEHVCGEVALVGLRRLHITKGEGASLLLADIEQGAPCKMRTLESAVGEAARREPAILERRPRKIGAAHRRHLKQASLEAAFRQVEVVELERGRKQPAAEGPARRGQRRDFVLGNRVVNRFVGGHRPSLVLSP